MHQATGREGSFGEEAANCGVIQITTRRAPRVWSMSSIVYRLFILDIDDHLRAPQSGELDYTIAHTAPSPKISLSGFGLVHRHGWIDCIEQHERLQHLDHCGSVSVPTGGRTGMRLEGTHTRSCNCTVYIG